ncbi:MAG TPA: NAD(+)--dinitrogen-reductase ADP-D-ribosyltransferase [Fibrobacteria bacterium]|nr:NAD(+)--dinitrogen-reductase ADP-D-ribosyltransferase [Fibrobacteria bacterium]HOX53517.1 NAD(+)--dinitrogen-reductase ADP-D-ribosyltransferase [Fibrobacteria bacterium]
MTSATHVSSRCSLPPWVLASQDYQEDPWPLEIVGTRESESRLFKLLERLTDPSQRGVVFHEYLVARFRLDQIPRADSPEPGTLQHSYLRFLRGWGADSNGYSGAVLKNWVESRFGLRPTYHAGILSTNEAARAKYLRDRMRGEAETMGLGMQLDLLYTFCQYELVRRHPVERWLTLYRGTHDPEEYTLDAPKGHVVLNNLSSFTSDREIAWEFGSSVWRVRVPIPKIVFFSGLLPRSILEGEKEYLVLGGRYKVETLRW